MTNITIQPMQWEQTPDITAVTAFDEKDEACFRDVRDVLRKHGALNRFGLTLLHSHFEVAEGEILLESTDVESRTQLVRPVKQSEIPEGGTIITNWRFAEGDEVAVRVCVCATANGHLGYHRNA